MTITCDNNLMTSLKYLSFTSACTLSNPANPMTEETWNQYIDVHHLDVIGEPLHLFIDNRIGSIKGKAFEDSWEWKMFVFCVHFESSSRANLNRLPGVYQIIRNFNPTSKNQVAFLDWIKLHFLNLKNNVDISKSSRRIRISC